MTTRKLMNGNYEAFYSKKHPITKIPVGTRRKTVMKNGKKQPIRSLADAKRVEVEIIAFVLDKIKKQIIPIWSKVVEEFVSSLIKGDYSRKTIDTYSLCLNAHTLKEWGDRTVDEITGDEIRNLVKSKVGHRSASQQKNVLKYIRAVFNFAVEKGYLKSNPTPSMKFKIGEKIKKVLTEQEIGKFLNQAKLVNTEWYPIWATALYTGMRNGELYALTWDKVNLNERLIVIDSSWNSKDGFKDTKSGDDRVIEIAPSLIPIFRQLKVQNFDSPFVLPRIDKWDKGEQARELRRFLEGLGLPRVRFHDLRASWATIMLSKGIAPIKVMAMGGWKDLKTMQIYVRKAGISVKGITNDLILHDPSLASGKVLNFNLRSEE